MYPTGPLVEGWSPACGAAKRDGTFRRWSGVGGSKVTEGVSLKGILGPCPLSLSLSLSMLPDNHEVNRPPPASPSSMMSCATAGPNQQGPRHSGLEP
jgi:hypothetical protein